MVLPTQWTWVWVNSGSWWWTGRPGVLRFMGSRRVGHDWATELNWIEWQMMLIFLKFVYFLFSLFLLSFCVIFLNSLIYLTVLGLSLRIFSCSMHSFSCDMQDLVPWPGIKPGRDALEAQSSSHCSVQFSHSVVSDSLWPHGLQHARLPCPSPTPRVYSNSCPLSRWCHPTISSSVVPFSSCPQSFPASGSFPMSEFFASGGQSIGAEALPSVLPMSIQDWFPFGWTGWISLQSKGLSRVSFSTTVWKHQFFGTQPSLGFNSHIHTLLQEKPQIWLYKHLSAK